MTAHSLIRRCISLLLLLAIVLGCLPVGTLNAKAQENTSALSEEKTNLRNGTGEDILVPTYPDIADHHLVSNNPYPQDTPQMGGFAFSGVHAYFIRTTEDGKTAAVYRTHLKNQSTGTVNFADAARLGEGKSMTAAGVNGKAYLFVSTGKTGTDAILLIQDVGGGTVNLKGGYTLQTIDGTPLQADSLAVLSVSGKNATLLIRSGYSFYTATMDATVTGDGTLTADFAFGMEEAATETMAKTLVSSPNALDVQLTGMDYEKEQDRLYLGVAVDCSTGILVYSNLSALIDSHTTAAEAALDQSIVVAGSGYEFFHVKDISVVQGVIYFSSMQRWITSNNLRGDICQLLDTSVPSQHRMQGFRESGTYLIGGTDDPSLVFKNVPDGNGYKIRIEALTGTPADAHLFGFESDAQGYWYIRSGIYIQGKAQAADLYLTAEADGTVSLKPKSAGDPNQLWYLQSKGLHKDNNGKENKIMAIYSKASGLYLGNGATGDAIFDVCVREEGKTFVLQLVNDTAKLESYLFDYEFYKLAYPKEVGNLTKTEASAHFKNTGKALGYLPSPYFDAKYYLAHNKDVRDAYGETNYERAYYHFITYGYWEGRQGSLYFSAKEYISRDKTQNAYKFYFPEKEKILYHFINYGSPDAATTDHWSGSNSFSVKEYAEEYNLTVSEKQTVNGKEETVTLGDVLLREYVASLIRLQDCASIEEFYELIFDVEVYKYMNRTDLTADKLSTITTAQATYNDKLTLHWEKYGRTEGRTASFIFNPSYYTSRYPDKVVSLSNAYEHYFNTGRKEGLVGSPYIAMSTEADITCKHPLTSTARFTACDEIGGLVTFCAKCHAVVNRIDAPAIAHTDSDSNHVCDLCKGTINEPLLTQNTILGLDLPGKDNALFADLSGFKHGSTNKPYGTYYLVHKGADGVHRVFDPMSQTLAGTIAATQVKVVDGRIIGADPGMAVQIHQKNADNTKDTNHYSIETEGGYYLYIGSEPIRIIRSNDTAKRNITVEVGNGNTTISLVRNLNISNPEYNNSSVKITLTNYLAFEQLDGNNYFEWSPMKGSKDVDNFFYLYRLAEDQLHTEGLYDVLQRAVSFIPTNSLYDITAHKNLLQMVHDAVGLYKQYNGIPLTGEELANKDELQKSLDLLERKIIDVLGILEINLRNSTVKYFSANMYNWDEDAMNALVATLPDADTKGFFFENAENTIGNAPYSFYDKTNSETVDGLNTYAQMYSIYSGIAAKDLSDSINPPFSNSVVAADYWSEATIDSVKDVYTNVNVPFVYKDGYYTLDSDQNGVFFEEEPASNATLAILEKPLTYYWSSGTTYGVGVPGHQAETLYSYRPSNNYVTGFQPFAQVTEFSAKSYKTDAYTAKLSTPVDSYMIDGIGWNSGATPTITGSGRGTPEWGFGMKLDVKFLMTEDGCLEGDANKPITFSFSGDDDVWVFIDGKLVMDIGGSHDAIQGEINFATGEVILRSDKFGRIRDKNEAGYGRSGDSTPLNASNEIGSILTNKMYQSVNFYSEIFDESITEFAASGEHTLTVYYMDRGKGRTNCAISFNLPQSDILVVEKDIPEYYGSEDGTLTDKTISDDTMSYLNTLDFGFTLTNGSSYASFREYNIYNEENVLIGTGITDSLGHFTLKNGQSAAFPNLQFNGQTYQVKEDSLNSRWAETKWSGSAAGTVLENTVGVLSPTASVTGDPYGSEVITYVCTNTYIYNPELIPEEQVVVMDYGKPIDIAVIDNAVFDGISDLVAREGILEAVALKDPADANYVTVQKNTSTNRDVRVSLKKMLDKAISLNCTVKVTLDDGAVHDKLVIPITILPATIMYYETDFLT
ncbi:MAG: fibro-slime domain-containing protein, partial [Oscillospiraceae bacterium]|nr:fibro-slime domain-containing protein [Oscillospiraceae bacterium]